MKIRYLMPLALALVAGNASAALITGETTQLSPTPPGGSTGTRFQTEYTIVGEESEVEYFEIAFDFDLFDNFVAESGPAGWGFEVVQRDGFISDGGYAFAFADVSPVGPNETLGGFLVSYDYLGAGAPDAQPFVLITTDQWLVEGTAGSASAAVPEPGMLALLGAGLFGVSAARRRRDRYESTAARTEGDR